MDDRLTPFEDKMKKSYHNLIETWNSSCRTCEPTCVR